MRQNCCYYTVHRVAWGPVRCWYQNEGLDERLSHRIRREIKYMFSRLVFKLLQLISFCKYRFSGFAFWVKYSS